MKKISWKTNDTSVQDANAKNIAQHKQAAAHHMEAAKHHLEGYKKIMRQGTMKKLRIIPFLLTDIRQLQGNFLMMYAKHHAQALKETNYR